MFILGMTGRMQRRKRLSLHGFGSATVMNSDSGFLLDGWLTISVRIHTISVGIQPERASAARSSSNETLGQVIHWQRCPGGSSNQRSNLPIKQIKEERDCVFCLLGEKANKRIPSQKHVRRARTGRPRSRQRCVF